MNISLPAALKSFVDEQAATQGYGTGGEYVRALLHKDLDRSRFRALLLHGAHSPPAAELETPYFDELRSRIRNHRRE